MPLVIHPRVRKAAARMAAATTLAMFASTGAALACPVPSTSQAFASQGDSSSYFPVPDGALADATLPGWLLSNASLTPGGAPFTVNGTASPNSITIQSGGTVTTAPFCIDSTMPTFRFAARPTIGGSPLQVQIVGTSANALGLVLDLEAVPDNSTSGWTLVNPASLTGGLPIPAGTDYYGKLRFRVPWWGGGAWQIDDIYVDPYRIG
jgi:hypothetical protein